MRLGRGLWAIALLLGTASRSRAASLPDHDPLRIHVISDEVNPHGLSPEELTQPGDISVALNGAASGLALASAVEETGSACVDDALLALASDTVDVLVYFAHRGARSCAGASAQTELTTAVEDLLLRGGGVVVFHHGLYEDPQKTAFLELIGASASGIAWDTVAGQRVFNVAPEHFITSHGLTYDGEAALAPLGPVPSGTFSYFDNIPDERYPSLIFLEQAGEERQILFASDTAGVRPLGYALSRPAWQGRVVGYQPGEYQPRALDDPDGQGLQILVNAVLWASGGRAGEPATGSGGQGSGSGGQTAGSGSTSSGSTGGAGATRGGGGDPGAAASTGGGGSGSSPGDGGASSPSSTGDGPSGGSPASVDASAGGSAPTGGNAAAAGTTGGAPTGLGDGAGATAGATGSPASHPSSCALGLLSGGASWALALPALLLAWRRRRGAPSQGLQPVVVRPS